MGDPIVALSFHRDENPGQTTREQYPAGYWYAYVSPGYDATGLTPLDAVTQLAQTVAKALADART